MSYTLTKLLIKSISIVVASFGLFSCYSEFLSIDYEVHYGAVWNNEKSCVALVASKKAYRNAKGLARFPDGGEPKYLVNKMGLYIFDPAKLQLSELIDFGELVDWQGSSISKWHVSLAFTDSIIYYTISPITEWNWYISKAKSDKQIKQIEFLQQKFSKSYSFNLKEKNSIEIDSSLFGMEYQKCIVSNKIEIAELNSYLSKIPLSDWSLLVKNIYPKSEKEYINEVIYGYNKSIKTRRAVIEQIIANKSKQEIEDILKKIYKHSNSLNGLRKKEYDFYIKETYERIKALL